MSILLKYFFWLLSLFSLGVYFLLGTQLGHVSLSHFVAEHYSKTMNNKIEVLSLNIDKYPIIEAEMRVNDKALLSIYGVPDKDDMNLTYHLRGDTFEWDDYSISEPVDVKGRMDGAYSELLISGKGKVFDGNISYSFIRKPNRLEKMKVNLKKVQSKPLLKFLSYKNILEGRIDVFLDFEYFTSYRRKGSAKVSMPKGTIPLVSKDVEVNLEAEVLIKDLLHEFSADIKSDLGKLRIGNGHYNRAANITTADYGLHINELSYFEDFLKHKYTGSLNTAGRVEYDNGDLQLHGDSTTDGGLLKYNYKNDYIDIDFKGVDLEKILRQLSFPPLLSAKVYGSASYDINEQIIMVNTKLKGTRFRRTKMTDKLYKMAGINVLKDVYNDSVFTAGYQDSILTSLLKIDNGVNHLYLKNTQMNSKTNKITADFEVKIDGQQFIGDIYGTLEHPKVNVDMSKLIKYQIKKKINNFFGTGKSSRRKNIDDMESEFNHQIKSFELERVERTGRSFLKGFFN